MGSTSPWWHAAHNVTHTHINSCNGLLLKTHIMECHLKTVNSGDDRGNGCQYQYEQMTHGLCVNARVLITHTIEPALQGPCNERPPSVLRQLGQTTWW